MKWTDRMSPTWPDTVGERGIVGGCFVLQSVDYVPGEMFLHQRLATLVFAHMLEHLLQGLRPPVRAYTRHVHEYRAQRSYVLHHVTVTPDNIQTNAFTYDVHKMCVLSESTRTHG